MKIISTAAIIAGTLLLFASIACAQEQQKGKELQFPKEMVQEHPSDLHMGSDPYLKKEGKKYEGSDETGYPREYDPNAEYKESSTTVEPVEETNKKHRSTKHHQE